MTLENAFQAFRSFLAEVRDSFSPEAVVWRLQCEADWLKGKLNHHYDALVRQRRDIERLTVRVSKYEKRRTALEFGVKACLEAGDKKGAYHQALELDQLRQGLDTDRLRLRRQRREHEEEVAMLRRLERRRDRVEGRLRALAPASGQQP
jgi:hypothetical protein